DLAASHPHDRGTSGSAVAHRRMGFASDGHGAREPARCFALDLLGCSVTAPMNVPFLSLRQRAHAPALPALQAQLTVFAREVGELYAAERTRSYELEMALDELRDTYLSTMSSFAQLIELTE